MKHRTVQDRRPRIYFDVAVAVWRVQVGKFCDTFARFIAAAQFARRMWDFGLDVNWQRGRSYSDKYGILPFWPRGKTLHIVHMVDLTSIDQIVIEAIAEKRKFLFKEDPASKVASVDEYIEEIIAPPPPPPKLSFVTRLASLEADLAKPPAGVFIIDSVSSAFKATE